MSPFRTTTRGNAELDIPVGHVFTQPWPAGGRRDLVIYYQYRADRARRTLRGIDRQVAKAAEAVAAPGPVKRRRFMALDGATTSVNRELEAKARSLAGLKGYLPTCWPAPMARRSPQSSFEIEKTFRMAKSDLQARPIYHHLRDSTEALLTIVFGALAVSRWIERQTGWSIRKQDRRPLLHHPDPSQAAHHYRRRTLPAGLRAALDQIHGRPAAR
jgi:hypothetical protein